MYAHVRSTGAEGGQELAMTLLTLAWVASALYAFQFGWIYWAAVAAAGGLVVTHVHDSFDRANLANHAQRARFDLNRQRSH